MSNIRYLLTLYDIVKNKFTFTIDEVEIQRNPYYPSERLGQRVEVGYISTIFENGFENEPTDKIDYPRTIDKKYLVTLSEACRHAFREVHW